jgi:membrane-associated two-gene conflict system component 1 (EACC1)
MNERLVCPAGMSVREGIFRMLYLSVDSASPVTDLEDLAEWLGQEPELRGLIKDGASTPGTGQLGAAVDVLVAAVGSGGTLTVLITSLQSWLSIRRTGLTVKLTGPDGSVSLNAKQVNDPEGLLQAARKAVGLE